MSAAAEAHDPGGKVKLRLKEGVRGGATFSQCGRHRTLLFRERDGARLPGHVLWIGMNPSTAAGDVDDPTVAKECRFTWEWGYGRYVKANVMDYRATSPKSLLAEGVTPCSPDNLPTILAEARSAAAVILAWGALHRRLAHHGEAVRAALAAEGIEAFCMGTTKDGHPRHPLYIMGSTIPAPFDLRA